MGPRIHRAIPPSDHRTRSDSRPVAPPSDRPDFAGTTVARPATGPFHPARSYHGRSVEPTDARPFVDATRKGKARAPNITPRQCRQTHPGIRLLIGVPQTSSILVVP
ncbi:uncharacterized protein LAESUDRAFT_451582 [Laetiporus sulphureus 93-53]|uniref:Uncharacterized protein n=1 Tax=Laetiporus sulphureus 93-53 TaxID=1314785 RepID=A0A165BXB7_9APHY|nr:uncharacterized protein LAESUDRAFT_451582 [Laetiporus sulphureus 93-53]KZT01822.1 hypothetical protein LAESUDRAFT_451582 [Laetiporus sulphureus 93-53]